MLQMEDVEDAEGELKKSKSDYLIVQSRCVEQRICAGRRKEVNCEMSA